MLDAFGDGVGHEHDPPARDLTRKQSRAQQPIGGTVEAARHIAVARGLGVHAERGVLGIDAGGMQPLQDGVLRLAAEEGRTLLAAARDMHQPLRAVVVAGKILVGERPVCEIPLGEARRAPAPEKRAAANRCPGVVVEWGRNTLLEVFVIRPRGAVSHEIVDLRREVLAAAERRRADVARQNERPRLEDHHGQPLARQFDGAGDTGRAGADDQDVNARRCLGNGKGVGGQKGRKTRHDNNSAIEEGMGDLAIGRNDVVDVALRQFRGD